MTSVLQVGFDLFFSEDICAGVNLALLGCLVHDRLEALDHEDDAEVLVAIECLIAVSEDELEGPLHDVEDAVAQVVEAHVVVFLLEDVHGLFCEFDLHVVEAITQHYHWDVLVDVRTERLDSLLREGVVPVTSGLHEQF